MSRLSIEFGSPAMDWLREAMSRPMVDRAIHINETPRGLQFKHGGGPWTTPLSPSAPRPAETDSRHSHAHTECGHQVCDGCGGHISYEESNDPHEHVVVSCYCCKHCGARGGH